MPVVRPLALSPFALVLSLALHPLLAEESLPAPAPLTVGQAPAAQPPTPPTAAPADPAGNPAGRWQVDAVLPFASYHWKRDGQDEFNPGFGLTIGKRYGVWTPYVGGVFYRDSHEETARGGFVGLRWAIASWIGLDYVAGYMRNSRYEGLALLPGMYVGYGHLNLNAVVLGKQSVGFMLRVTL